MLTVLNVSTAVTKIIVTSVRMTLETRLHKRMTAGYMTASYLAIVVPLIIRIEKTLGAA